MFLARHPLVLGYLAVLAVAGGAGVVVWLL